MIAVSGATGLLGSHLLYQLALSGEQDIIAFYRSEHRKEKVKKVFSYYTSDNRLFDKIKWVEIDLMEIASLDEVFENFSIRQVYHCAAVVSFDPREADFLVQHNRDITANMVNVSLHHSIESFCHVSSVAALGRDPEGNTEKLINEETEYIAGKHNSKYAQSKYESELEVWRGQEEGLNVCIVNPSIIIGPGFWDEGSGKLFSQYANGFRYFTQGVNAFVDVRDVANAMVLLVEKKCFGERFIVAAENLSYQDFFSKLSISLGKKSPDIEIKLWMAAIFWRLENLRSKISGKRPLVTKETTQSALSIYKYSSLKVKKTLGIEFISISKSIHEFSKLFKEDMR